MLTESIIHLVNVYFTFKTNKKLYTSDLRKAKNDVIKNLQRQYQSIKYKFNQKY